MHTHKSCNLILWWCDTIIRKALTISARFSLDFSILHISATCFIHTMILRDSALLHNGFINGCSGAFGAWSQELKIICRRGLPWECISAIIFPWPGIQRACVCMGLIYDLRMISHHSPGIWLFMDRIYGSLLPLFLAIFSIFGSYRRRSGGHYTVISNPWVSAKATCGERGSNRPQYLWGVGQRRGKKKKNPHNLIEILCQLYDG